MQLSTTTATWRRLTCALLLALAASAGHALDIYQSEDHEDRFVELDPSLKLSTLASRNPPAPLFYPSRNTLGGFARLRLHFSGAWSNATRGEFAYEMRTRWNSARGQSASVRPTGAGGAPAPWRIASLDASIASNDNAALRHEIDRAWIARQTSWGELRVGRQAIGLGRGVLFSAIDLFAPFSPTEPDREWRRGVDALTAEWRLGPASSAGLIGVFADTWRDSALLLHYRGYLGEIDGEFIAGKYARDFLVGGSLSAVLGGGEIHLELAAFSTPEAQPGGGLFGNRYLAGKTVLGGSYTFGVGNGLTALIEYHYSGFGAKDIDNALAELRDPERQQRFARGDSQILGRHALALQLSYPLTMNTSLGLLALQSPCDGSGLIAPSVDVALNQTASFRAFAYIPWGAEPKRGRLRSEYGAAPLSLFAQLAFYF